MNLRTLSLVVGLLGTGAYADVKSQAFSQFGTCEGKATESSRVIVMKVSLFVDLKAMFSGKEEFDAAMTLSSQPERGSRKEEVVLFTGAQAVMSEKDSKKTMEIKHTIQESRDEMVTTLTINLKDSSGELRIAEGREERVVTMKCELPR